MFPFWTHDSFAVRSKAELDAGSLGPPLPTNPGAIRLVQPLADSRTTWLVPWIWFPRLPLAASLFLRGPESFGLAQYLAEPQRGFPGTDPRKWKSRVFAHQGVSALLWDLCGLSANLASELQKPEMERWLGLWTEGSKYFRMHFPFHTGSGPDQEMTF